MLLISIIQESRIQRGESRPDSNDSEEPKREEETNDVRDRREVKNPR